MRILQKIMGQLDTLAKSHKKNYRPERNKNYGFSTLEIVQDQLL